MVEPVWIAVSRSNTDLPLISCSGDGVRKCTFLVSLLMPIGTTETLEAHPG